MTAIRTRPCEAEAIRSARGAACTVRQQRWVLAATIIGSSMAFVDGTIVNVALPAIQRDLDATASDMQWVVESYALFLAALLLVGGSLGDHYGRRRIFMIGVALFAAASASAQQIQFAEPIQLDVGTSSGSFEAYGRRFSLALGDNERVLAKLPAQRKQELQRYRLMRGTLDGQPGSWVRLTESAAGIEAPGRPTIGFAPADFNTMS